MPLTAEYSRVYKYAAKFGVRICKGPPPGRDAWKWFPSPFVSCLGDENVGIWWPTRQIHWDPDLPDLTPTGLVHELGHVIMGVKPDEVNEVFGGMLAWEYVSQRRLRLSTWTSFMSNYNADYDLVNHSMFWRRWPELSPHRRGKVIKQSLKGAVRRRLLTPEGEVIFKQVRAR